MNILRSLKYWWQRCIRGWDDSDTWSLDNVIAKFTLPRLKRFKELNNGFPCGLSEEKWDEILDDMIYSLEIISNYDEIIYKDHEVDWDRLKRGHELFGKHFRDLWW